MGAGTALQSQQWLFWPVTHLWPLSPSPDALRTSHPRYDPPASLGTWPVLSSGTLAFEYHSTGRDTGTHPWGLGSPVPARRALPRVGWKGLEVLGQRGSAGFAPGQMGFTALCAVLSSPEATSDELFLVSA